MKVKRRTALAVLVIVGALTAACSPEVGSEEWCADLKDKPKGDWSANEAKDFAKHCILG
ncbi:DUF3012 domain-containing protein [Pelagibius sp. Alg239-R121]|uniref:DUF3012 domain-containing protein n=1 Tax=Pelagibius sp. Alg239-R121 TaxID=2993448 RepID=UPI0024A70A48|nr:DUF3012 domain-containing protein [Pelagibius sp. Alg239-R121]